MNIVNWVLDSNRYKHILGGMAIGLGADDVYCAVYAGIGVAGALELKDHLYGQGWDWTDFTLTLAGVAIGQGVRIGFANLIGL